jgi:two-component system chemotaxis sensor kinase CheA
MVEHFLRDRRGFQTFWGEATSLVGDIVRDDLSPDSTVKRSLHTLKGNAAYFGLNRISRLCHELESAMEERREARLTAAERTQFTSLWGSLGQRVETLMQGNSAVIDVSPEDYERLLAAVRKRVPFEELEELLKNLRRETIAGRLERAKHMLEVTCAKLGKARPTVEIQHDGSRLPSTSWTPFWNVLAHVLTNAADHGLEGDDEREAAGKVLPGRVWLSAVRKGEELLIEVRDDGRGLDWKLIEARAREAGLPHGSRQALVDALLTEGFTLKATVSEISGRGVGMAAVRSVVHNMGGRIEVESEPGHGTAWRFRFQVRIAHDPGKAGTTGSARRAELDA